MSIHAFLFISSSPAHTNTTPELYTCLIIFYHQNREIIDVEGSSVLFVWTGLLLIELVQCDDVAEVRYSFSYLYWPVNYQTKNIQRVWNLLNMYVAY
jgi:hypothetical protein